MDAVGAEVSYELLRKLSQHLELTRMFQVSGLVVNFYDFILTFPDEIQHIWPSPWSAIKVLFLLNRYIPPFALIVIVYDLLYFTGDVTAYVVAHSLITGMTDSGYRCQHLIFLLSCWNICTFAVWNAIMTIRVHALWGLRRYIAVTLSILYVCSTAAAITLTVIHDIHIARGVIVARDLKICIPGAELPHTYFVVWLPSICYESLLFVMTMYKVVGPERKSSHSISHVLLRDGVLYFSVITAMRVANLGLFIQRDPSISYLVLFLFVGFGSALVSRMVLNLRTWNRRDVSGDGEMHVAGQSHQISNIQFASPRARPSRIIQSRFSVHSHPGHDSDDEENDHTPYGFGESEDFPMQDMSRSKSLLLAKDNQENGDDSKARARSGDV